MEREYLERYFGSNSELQRLGKKLILSKDKKRALKINQLLKSLGESSSDVIREKILYDISKESAYTKPTPTSKAGPDKWSYIIFL